MTVDPEPPPTDSRSMRAWISHEPGRLTLVSRSIPEPSIGEVLVRVEACGICRTDLHLIDRELPPHLADVIPGHQVVGVVVAIGAETHHFVLGDRVGIAWLRATCGSCPWCREGQENLCPSSRYTGWDADGGMAEYAVAPEAFVYPLPSEPEAAMLAPLLCAGIIGYRALARANLPPGGRLGIYGFGSSAHLTAQLAIAQGAEVLAMTRGASNRDLALRLGATFAGTAMALPPRPADAAIVFAPAGELVPVALQSVRAGGTVVLAGIHMSDVPMLDYTRDLFGERDLRTVAANTRADGAAFLRLAKALGITPSVSRYPFTAADAAVEELRAGTAAGSLVVTV